MEARWGIFIEAGLNSKIIANSTADRKVLSISMQSMRIFCIVGIVDNVDIVDIVDIVDNIDKMGLELHLKSHKAGRMNVFFN